MYATAFAARLAADLGFIGFDVLAGVVGTVSVRVDAAHETVSDDYRLQLEAARAGGERLEALRRERASSGKSCWNSGSDCGSRRSPRW